MSDLIERQAAIDAIKKYMGDYELSRTMQQVMLLLPSAQQEPLVKESRTLVKDLVNDTISRTSAIDTVKNMRKVCDTEDINDYYDLLLASFDVLPSTQPTLCGYDIKHLILIANVLRKENLPPERIIEALTDIGRIVSIVTDEFEESLRKAVEQ